MSSENIENQTKEDGNYLYIQEKEFLDMKNSAMAYELFYEEKKTKLNNAKEKIAKLRRVNKKNIKTIEKLNILLKTILDFFVFKFKT